MSQSTIVRACWNVFISELNQYKNSRKSGLAQGHNKVPPVVFTQETSRSHIQHSTTEPLRSSTCVDPGILFRGGSMPDGQKTVWTTFFFCFIFSPQLILQFTEGLQWFYYIETILFQGSRGGPTFIRGGGGPNGNFYRNLYNL